MTGNRRAIVHLGTQQIARMLALPDGMRVLACRDDFVRDGVAVLVEGDMLEEQAEACVLPDVPVSLLDCSELAMRADVGIWYEDGAAVGVVVRCPVGGCRWSHVVEVGPVVLAQLADVVKRHLDEAHAGP